MLPTTLAADELFGRCAARHRCDARHRRPPVGEADVDQPGAQGAAAARSGVRCPSGVDPGRSQRRHADEHPLPDLRGGRPQTRHVRVRHRVVAAGSMRVDGQGDAATRGPQHRTRARTWSRRAPSAVGTISCACCPSAAAARRRETLAVARRHSVRARGCRFAGRCVRFRRRRVCEHLERRPGGGSLDSRPRRLPLRRRAAPRTPRRTQRLRVRGSMAQQVCSRRASRR